MGSGLFLSDSFHIRRNSIRTMRVNAPKIGLYKAISNDCCIIARNAVASKHIVHEGFQVRGVDVVDRRSGLGHFQG